MDTAKTYYCQNCGAVMEFDAASQNLKCPSCGNKIEIENETVTYCEQTFDYTHIFCFEFWDDEFEDLNYFAIDG